MFLELIATFIAGIAGAGLMMMLNWLTGRRLPRWLVPVAGGAAMIVATISSEYSWFGRTVNTLPEGVEIAHTVESKVLYRPWTYVHPYVERFMAVDKATIRLNDAQPGMVLVDLLLFGRWQPVRQLAVMFDCVNLRQTQVPEVVVFDDSGALTGAKWVSIDADDPALVIACGGK